MPDRAPEIATAEHQADSSTPRAARRTVLRRAAVAAGSVAAVGAAAVVVDRLLVVQDDEESDHAAADVTQSLHGFHTDGVLQPGQAQVLLGPDAQLSTDPTTWVYQARGISPLEAARQIPRYPGLIQQPLGMDARGQTYVLPVDAHGNILLSHGSVPRVVGFGYVAAGSNPFALPPGTLCGVALYDNVKIDTENDDATEIVRVNNQTIVATFLYRDVIDAMLQLQIVSPSSWLSPLPLAIDYQAFTKTHRYNAFVVSLFSSRTNGRVELLSPIPATLVRDAKGTVDISVTDSWGNVSEGKDGDEIPPTALVTLRGQGRARSGAKIYPMLAENLLGAAYSETTDYNLIAFWRGPFLGIASAPHA